jgi:hypothetical protein
VTVKAFLTASLAALILAGAASAAEAAPPEAATEVREVTVTGVRTDWLLSFVISGDVDAKTFVASAPLGINCGGPAYQYQTNPIRKCWLRILPGRTVLLGATAPGRFGTDWTVEWTGCKPVNDGSMCEIVMSEDASAGATFKRRG